jgi:LysM repeat protein
LATKGGEVIRTSDADYISLLLIVLCVLMLLALYALSQSPATADAGVPVPDEHSVQPGDTLWQIARRY